MNAAFIVIGVLLILLVPLLVASAFIHLLFGLFHVLVGTVTILVLLGVVLAIYHYLVGHKG